MLGVECGILAGKIEGLDCISMGPDILIFIQLRNT